jgi:hypothetical protein
MENNNAINKKDDQILLNAMIKRLVPTKIRQTNFLLIDLMNNPSFRRTFATEKINSYGITGRNRRTSKRR